MTKISRRKFVAGAATIAIMYPAVGIAALKQRSRVVPYDPPHEPQYRPEFELPRARFHYRAFDPHSSSLYDK